jgi:hypothetical protein
MSKGNRALRLSWKQVGYAIALAVLIWYAVAIIDVIKRGNEAQRMVEAMETEIASLEKQQQALRAELDYARSDAYVEQAAREELKYSEPGEIVLVPVPMERSRPGQERLQQESLGQTELGVGARATPSAASPKLRWEEFKAFLGFSDD